MIRIGPALKAARRHQRGRRLDQLVGVEIEVRKDGVVLARPLVLVVVLQKRVRRPRHAADVVRIDEPLGAQRFCVAHEQLHGLLLRLAALAVEECLFRICKRQGHIVKRAAISSMPSHRFWSLRFSSKLCWLSS